MSYWFTKEIVPAFTRPISPIFECGDKEIMAWIFEVWITNEGQAE